MRKVASRERNGSALRAERRAYDVCLSKRSCFWVGCHELLHTANIDVRKVDDMAARLNQVQGFVGAVSQSSQDG